MELWRISNYSDLSGVGGLRAAGRWHSQGRRIVYLADHPSSALLEMLVHMDRDLIPATYQLLRILVPEEIAIEPVDADLPMNWRSQTMVSRKIGDHWLDRSTRRAVASALGDQRKGQQLPSKSCPSGRGKDRGGRDHQGAL